MAPFSAARVEPIEGMRWHALVDAWTLSPSRRRALGDAVVEGSALPVFDAAFAGSAMEMSPLLMALRDDPAQRAAQLDHLERCCAGQPALSLLMTRADGADVVALLRRAMMPTLDGRQFLLRLADVPSMMAFAALVPAAMRREVWAPIEGWWVVDAWGRSCNLVDASGAADPSGGAARSFWPMELDDDAVARLLEGAQPATTAARLRNVEPKAGRGVDPAAQMRRAWACLEAARDMGLADDDPGQFGWILEHWRQVPVPPLAAEATA